MSNAIRACLRLFHNICLLLGLFKQTIISDLRKIEVISVHNALQFDHNSVQERSHQVYILISQPHSGHHQPIGCLRSHRQLYSQQAWTVKQSMAVWPGLAQDTIQYTSWLWLWQQGYQVDRQAIPSMDAILNQKDHMLLQESSYTTVLAYLCRVQWL